jgi:hypothetical protein
LEAVNFPEFIIRRHLARMFLLVSRVACTYLQADQIGQSMPLSASQRLHVF